MSVKYRIDPPKGSDEDPIIMEFDTYEQMMAYLARKNDEIHWNQPETERLSFRPGVIE